MAKKNVTSGRSGSRCRRPSRTARRSHRPRAGRQPHRREAAATQQRTGAIGCRARPGKAHVVVAEASPAWARRRLRHPVRHPLEHVAYHVVGASRRDATATRAGGLGDETACRVAVRRPVVRSRVRRPVRPHLPPCTGRQPLARVGARFPTLAQKHRFWNECPLRRWRWLKQVTLPPPSQRCMERERGRTPVRNKRGPLRYA